MKILYVTSKGSIHDYRFLKNLVNDYTVMLLHYAADRLIPEIENLPGIEIISKKPVFRAFPLLSELSHFKKIVKSFKPDVVHTGYVWQVGTIAAYAGVHPHLSMPWGSDVLIEPGKKLFAKRLASKVFRTCDHVQCDAEFVKAKIMNDYGVSGDKITVFPWGIDLELFKPMEKTCLRQKSNIPNDKFVVIFNRNLEEVYGIHCMLNAFMEFQKDKNDVLLLIVSDGSQTNDVTGFIAKNKLEDKVRLVGKIPNIDMSALLNCSDVYLSTSLSDGTSLSLLEALACGTGIVVTDVPAIKEWVTGENGIVVQRNNSHQTALALEKYYYSRELIKQHGDKNILIAKKRADWNKNYLKLKEIYSKLCE
ncbi:MAG TPA: glycosyltransferase family 4 protein [Ignavibacteria bacterium]|nr:glycosyltransferase family 4 protein [Ignavibacteria bacterium]